MPPKSSAAGQKGGNYGARKGGPPAMMPARRAAGSRARELVDTVMAPENRSVVRAVGIFVVSGPSSPFALFRRDGSCNFKEGEWCSEVWSGTESWLTNDAGWCCFPA